MSCPYKEDGFFIIPFRKEHRYDYANSHIIFPYSLTFSDDLLLLLKGIEYKS